MEFVANNNLNVKRLLRFLSSINESEYHNACEVYGRFAKEYHLQAIHLAVFMLKVLPLKPHEDEYWDTLAVTVTGGSGDTTFKNNTVKTLKSTWSRHKKEILQNLYRCKQLVSDTTLHLSINSLLQLFSKHWLDLDHVGNVKYWPLSETADNKSDSDDALTSSSAFHLNGSNQHLANPVISVKPTLTIEHLVMAMKKVHPFCPNKLGYWIALVSAANNSNVIGMAKVHAQELQQFWCENKELISLLTGEPLQSNTAVKYPDSLNLMNVSDDSDDDANNDFGGTIREKDDNSMLVTNTSHLLESTWSTEADFDDSDGKFEYSGNCKLYPYVQVCVADVLHAIGTTIPFTPSDHGFWLKIVKKISPSPRQNINFIHAATRLRCMWLLSMHGVSSILSNNTQLAYKSIVKEATDCELGTSSKFSSKFNQFTDIESQACGTESIVKSPDLISDITFKIWKPHYSKFGEPKYVDTSEEMHIGNDCKQFKFNFDASFFNNLKDSMMGNNKFASNMWKKYILRKIKQHNQYCIFAFKSHWVSNKVYSKCVFFCQGFCKRSDCKLLFKVYVQNDVTFSTVVTFYNVSKSSCKFALVNVQ
uniref:Uncharacterized protein LOC108950684 n=1 Tax=Phallusia mammillata TaxID=59560 RepID=A0A6F9DK16_9ASCI|nr:uncharacterized protein LOC108950684 [Phallusia mammillata]